MDNQHLIQFIRSNIPHITPQEDTIAHIATTFEPLLLEKGEFLVKQGKVGGYFILLEGYLRAFTFTDKGDEVTTYFYPPNRVIFEAASFLLAAALLRKISRPSLPAKPFVPVFKSSTRCSTPGPSSGSSAGHRW